MKIPAQFTLITVKEGNLIKHFGWEIQTHSMIMMNKRPIETKNTCYNSMVTASKKYLKEIPKREKVKTREVIISEVITP
jgi:hypothetical protein